MSSKLNETAGCLRLITLGATDHAFITLHNVSNLELTNLVVVQVELDGLPGSFYFRTAIIALFLLNDEVLRLDSLHILVLHSVTQGLKLLWRTSIVLQHDQKSLRSGYGALIFPSLFKTRATLPLGVTLGASALGKEPVVYLLH